MHGFANEVGYGKETREEGKIEKYKRNLIMDYSESCVGCKYIFAPFINSLLCLCSMAFYMSALYGLQTFSL